MKNKSEKNFLKPLILLFAVAAVFFVIFFRTTEAKAASAKGLEAYPLIWSAKQIEMRPGERAKFAIGFKNAGSVSWKKSGKGFVSIYTYEPKYRKSKFKDSSWRNSIQPAILKNDTKPGEIGYIEFYLKAPADIAPGDYKEVFYLASEDTAWISGGKFEVPIKIKGKSAQGAEQKAASFGDEIKPYQAALLLQSHKKLAMPAGAEEEIRLGFKNIGSRTWDKRAIKINDDANIVSWNGASIFYHPTWASNTQPNISGEITKPGEVALINFKIKAPNEPGDYKAKFFLAANDQPVEEGIVELPVTVTEDQLSSGETGTAHIVNLKMDEPQIRIGLYFTEEPIELTANGSFSVYDLSNNLVADFDASQAVNIAFNFSKREYRLSSATANAVFSSGLRFITKDKSAIFTILSYSQITEGGWNDNKFRGKIEINQSPNTGRLWVINELPLEEYLYGMAETSNASPIEFQKANIVAARTYALYHFLSNSKYNGFFTIRAWAGDQVYRGYNSELRRPRQKQVVDESRGQIVTYNGEIAITPYFARSDGRTRAWTEVWNGKEKPWLISKQTSYDQGLVMWGHGVGMSQNDAYNHAKNAGWNYGQILKYYYTDTEITKIY